MCAAFAVYSAVVYTSGTETPHLEPISEPARAGQQVFQEYNCIACHQFYGLGGYMGPDLTNVISKRGPIYARAFIASGSARMPNFKLSEPEISALIEYLTFVDGTGSYPPENYQVNWYGTVVQEDDPQ
ncbi:MAG: cytochrome c [Gammaproteobacteria bacterium]|nr:cytochrome c [Gammaproteobacteria bacterium]MDH4316361.1 cytochrome c [Gammaproteobacteria bacterium]MDH5215469.1 cytochrome c [Gammaproteobacteria bacterium]MDH5500532.1 cytochrome c [Gammaproteobacteria bacterium]